jgi:hypothetical protein
LALKQERTAGHFTPGAIEGRGQKTQNVLARARKIIAGFVLAPT